MNAPAALPAATLTDLSPRQRQILEALCNGRARKQIQAELGISQSTLTTHLHRARIVFGARHDEQLTSLFTRLIIDEERAAAGL